jgi:hypothetical protein
MVVAGAEVPEWLAESCSSLPGGTDDEVGQVVAEAGWRLAAVVAAGRLGPACSGESKATTTLRAARRCFTQSRLSGTGPVSR